MLSPEELRRISATTRKTRIDKAMKEQRDNEEKARVEREDRIVELVGLVESTLDRDIERAAKDGGDKVQIRIGNEDSRSKASNREFYKEVVSRITVPEGFSIKMHEECTTEYYSDGAGPGPSKFYALIDWSK